MARTRKAKLLPEARALYAEGASKPVIAEALKVPLRTVQRWAQQDAKAGRPWQRGPSEPRMPAGRRPPLAEAPRSDDAGKPSRADNQEPRSLTDRLCRRLEERLEGLIEKSEGKKPDPRLEDRMLKICKVLEYLRGEDNDLSAQLRAMKRFATFCVQTLSEEEMTPVRKATRLFLEDLKREHS